MSLSQRFADTGSTIYGQKYSQFQTPDKTTNKYEFMS